MAPPIILLPPSEGKAPGGSGAPFEPGTLVFPELDRSRRKVAGALKRTMRSNVGAVGKLLGVKGDALATARVANREVLDAPTLPAIERYTGVLYDAFDHAGLSTAHRRRAAAQVLVFSGLWGVVAPGDPIPDYKLKMGAALDPLGRLNTFWKPQITAAIRPVVEGRAVWDLLPNEHSAAWNPAATGLGRRISVRFLDDVPDGAGRKLIAVSHWNKLLKGALVRHVLATQIDDHTALAAFDHPMGYRYEPSLTEVSGDLVTVSLVARTP